jgi:hypothetical protein
MSEVFVSDIQRIGPDNFVCGVQWPRRHVLYSEPGICLDSALVAETIRQITILASHSMYDVPAGARFLMTGLVVDVIAPSVDTRHEPPNIVARVTVDGVRYRGVGSVRTLRANVDFLHHGELVAAGRGDATIVDDVTYARLRSTGLPVACEQSEARALDPETVGVRAAVDVVIGEQLGEHQWPLVVDTSNSVFFDHPLDHVPGMVIIEAMKQASKAYFGPPASALTHLDVRFLNVVELNAPTFVSVVGHLGHEPGPTELRLEITQGGRVAAEAVVTLNPERTTDRWR